MLKYVVAHFWERICVRIGVTDEIERFYLSAITSFHLGYVTEEYFDFRHDVDALAFSSSFCYIFWHGRVQCDFSGSIL